MAGINMNVEFTTRFCEVKGELGYFHLWEQWSNVVDASPVDKSGRFMGSSNSEMVFVGLTHHPSSFAMKKNAVLCEMSKTP